MVVTEKMVEAAQAVFNEYGYNATNEPVLRRALSAALEQEQEAVGWRKILQDLRNEDDSDYPVNSERKAGWHAALDAFEEAALASPVATREDVVREATALFHQIDHVITGYSIAGMDLSDAMVELSKRLDRLSTLLEDGR